MARAKKTVETPGQETTQLQDAAGEDQSAGITEAPTVDPEATALAARNAILANINAQGAAIVARFEEYAFTDIIGHPLTNCLDFLNLVRKATDVSTGGTAEQVTNEEGKKQPVRSAPVLTEHGWHVPG
ncbi:TPA: hypothetical protein R0J09_004845 [Klebsiella quasipneumoniae]|nr:hypothetical protein [Klebsiella quasipneumoniae]